MFGGLGFIGSNFVNYVTANEPSFEIQVLDAFTYAARAENLDDSRLVPSSPTLLQDNQHYRDLLDDVDWVINFAAETHNDNSISDPGRFIESNVLGVFRLLEALRESDAKLLQISTDEVYGDTELDSETSFSEESQLKPSSPYSASKASADMLVQAWGRTYGLPYIISRCTNNYGPNQHPEKFIPTVRRSIDNGTPIPIYGSGNNIRDWIHVDDHSSAILTLIRRGKLGEIYNVGAHNYLSNLQLVSALLENFGGRADSIQMVADRPGHDRRYALDTSKIEKLGWCPVRTFKGFSRSSLDGD